MLQPGHTVGIDLGTTYSAISLLDDTGIAQLLPNSDGNAITPSVVLLGDDSQVVVGPSIERMSIEDPQRIVGAIKREMGNSDFYTLYQGHKLAPEVISSLILKKLRLDAERQIGPIGNAVITVPYYFNDVRRKATQDAGEIAGLNVIDIINEPTAAALAYAWNRGELGHPNMATSEKNILVFDLGGGTFDVTVMTYTSTRLQVKATDGDVMLGGLDWTQRLVEKVVEEFVRKHSIDPRDDPESLAMLTLECEDAKRDLSSKPEVAISAYSRGKSLTISMTRGEFERLTGDLLQRTRDTTELAMEQAGLRKGQLDEVLLVGGSTLMPVVKTMLREVTGCEPSQELDPDKAVAQGAAIHAAILGARATGKSSSLAKGVIERLSLVGLKNVSSHSLGIKIRMNGRKVNHIMIPRNSSIPCDVTQQFATTKPNQRHVHVCVLEGDASDPDACTQIGDFHIRDLPTNLPVGSRVEIKYAYTGDGRISVSASELTSGRESFVEIDRYAGLDQVGLDNCRCLIEEFRID